jgi:hypothetical protein
MEIARKKKEEEQNPCPTADISDGGLQKRVKLGYVG